MRRWVYDICKQSVTVLSAFIPYHYFITEIGVDVLFTCDSYFTSTLDEFHSSYGINILKHELSNDGNDPLPVGLQSNVTCSRACTDTVNQ